MHGPGNIYYSLAKHFVSKNVTALQLDYRSPNQLKDCVQDLMDGIEYLNKEHCIEQVVLVGKCVVFVAVNNCAQNME